MKTRLLRSLGTNAYSNFIGKSPKPKMTQVSCNGSRVKHAVHSHPVDYFSTIKREKILTHKTTCMNLLSLETSTAWERKSPELICLWCHWYDVFLNDNRLQTEIISVCQEWRRGWEQRGESGCNYEMEARGSFWRWRCFLSSPVNVSTLLWCCPVVS